MILSSPSNFKGKFFIPDYSMKFRSNCWLKLYYDDMIICNKRQLKSYCIFFCSTYALWRKYLSSYLSISFKDNHVYNLNFMFYPKIHSIKGILLYQKQQNTLYLQKWQIMKQSDSFKMFHYSVDILFDLVDYWHSSRSTVGVDGFIVV